MATIHNRSRIYYQKPNSCQSNSIRPHDGSGTIGLSTLKRKIIGIEKNPKTFEIAKVRINKQQEFEGIKEEDD